MSILNKAGELRFVSHGALINSQLTSLDVIKALPIGTTVKRNNFVFGAGNNWAKTHYTEGSQLIDAVVDVIRAEAESCDCADDLKLDIYVMVVQVQD